MNENRVQALKKQLDKYFLLTGQDCDIVVEEKRVSLRKDMERELTVLFDDAIRAEILDEHNNQRKDLLNDLNALTNQFLDGNIELSLFLMKISAIAANSRHVK